VNPSDSQFAGLNDPQIQSLRSEIINQMDDRIAEALQRLPPEYFLQIPKEDHLQHFKALVAVKVCDIQQEIMIRHRDGQRVTIVSHQNYPGLLARLLKILPDDKPLVGAKIFTSTDQDFIVDVFDFQQPATDQHEREATQENEELVAEIVARTNAEPEAVKTFLNRYHHEHEILKSPDELAHQFDALRETAHMNDIRVLCKDEPDSLCKITVSAASATTREMFVRAAEFFGLQGIDIRRAIFENVIVKDSIEVALLTFKVEVPAEYDSSTLAMRMEHYLRVDSEVVASISNPEDDLLYAELFCCLGKLTQHVINFCANVDISHERVLRTMRKHDELSTEAIEGFQSRFDDSFASSDSNRAPESAKPLESRLSSIADPQERLTLRTLFRLCSGIQRANLNVGRRRGLAFRLPGEIFENQKRGNTPFAIFYVFGHGFDGFHVRFRNVSRGGMRLVPTRNEEHYLFESARVFDETWRLATAQQLKNKDIAEGGSKAVVVVKPGNSALRAGRDFVDGLLDLLVDIDSTSASDVDSIGEEYLYLGPDENVTNELIDWIVERAEERSYRYPATIMSSKPATGINHKEFGVTSEGVMIFLKQALIEHGIDPTKSAFSVKLTGGPDGDVGGNAIRIMVRDYPDTARIVGVADGTGAASDPNGLSHSELMRLVDAGLGIVHFDGEKLSAEGLVTALDSESDVARRNELHNRIKSDVFLPAGGRPSTINQNNWQRFLDEDGTPASPIIVEGANLFITDVARTHLSKHSVLIVKDSSANKCGVICSSMEIIAGMMLTEEQFLRIKPRYVKEVLQMLCSLAKIESISLFNEAARQPNLNLPEISVRISEQIIRVADVVDASIGQWNETEQQLANDFVRGYLPSSLIETVGVGLFDRIPATYRSQLIASILSNRIVYREGCQNLESMLDPCLARLVRQHLVYESKSQLLLQSVADSNLPDKDMIAAIIEHSGARSQRDLRM
jgi:glutamate dehydrogenase